MSSVESRHESGWAGEAETPAVWHTRTCWDATGDGTACEVDYVLAGDAEAADEAVAVLPGRSWHRASLGSWLLLIGVAIAPIATGADPTANTVRTWGGQHGRRPEVVVTPPIDEHARPFGHARVTWSYFDGSISEWDYAVVADAEAAEDLEAAVPGPWHRIPIGPFLLLARFVVDPVGTPVGDPPSGMLG